MAAVEDPNLEEPLELGPEVTCFLRGSAKKSEEEEKVPSPKPPVKVLHKWVAWKAEACKMPSWWRELMAVPDIEDWQKLACEVRALFWHPKRAREVHKTDNHHQALPAPPCLLWRSFMPPPNSIYACWDIQEMQREKTMAYAHALQHWAEKTDLHTGGKPHLLAESVKVLQGEMRCYLSFSDKEVFEGVIPPKDMSPDPAKDAKPHSMATMPAIAPEVQATTKAVEEPAAERKSPKFPSWEKVLHPSQPVVAVGQIPHLSGSPGRRFCNLEMMAIPPETPYPTQELEVVQWVTLTPGFLGVMPCLRSQLPEEVHEASPDPLVVGVMTAPGVATMCTSCIVRDDLTGATYLDMVTTSVGRVALSGPKQETPVQGPVTEDVTDLI